MSDKKLKELIENLGMSELEYGSKSISFDAAKSLLKQAYDLGYEYGWDYGYQRAWDDSQYGD